MTNIVNALSIVVAIVVIGVVCWTYFKSVFLAKTKIESLVTLGILILLTILTIHGTSLLLKLITPNNGVLQ